MRHSGEIHVGVVVTEGMSGIATQHVTRRGVGAVVTERVLREEIGITTDVVMMRSPLRSRNEERG